MINIKKLMLLSVVMSGSAIADSNFYGPVRYKGFSDSPFNGISFTQFYLEDFEDGVFNSPGVTAINNNPGGSELCVGGLAEAADSVDEDDGNIDGLGKNGYELSPCANDGGDNYGITFAFDKAVLGGLPTHVGIVWTDGSQTSPTLFQAFDANGNLLGKLGTVKISDNSFYGTTDEDRFFGASSPNGISKIILRDPNGVNSLSVDHLQYGFSRNVPYHVSGTVIGLDKTNFKLTCTNITTGQTLTVAIPKKLTEWTCDNINLPITKGDNVQINVKATGLAK